MALTSASTEMPVVRSLADFPAQSGNLLERVVFNHRRWLMLACLVLTLLLGFMATRVQVNASFEKMIPTGHPYIQNFLEHRKDLRGMGNSLRIVVENTQGDVYDARFLEAFKQVNDELFLMPGVDRA